MRINLKPVDGRKSPGQKSHGFTLLEVLISAAISAIVLAAVFSGISNTFSMLSTSRENLRATQIIMSRIEALRLESWGNGSGASGGSQLFNPTNVPPTFTDYFYPQGLNNNTNNYGTVYSGTVTVNNNFTLSPPCSYNGAMAMVTISVSWTDVMRGVTNNYSRSMSTLVAQSGIQNYVFNSY
jgi:prepilin-type N-terminal cleavage/methylation domain-containing protein